MTRNRLCAGAATVATGLLLATWPLAAHHAFSAEFDINKPVTLQGVVTKVEWVSPHAWLWVDVKDEAGKVTKWSFEMGAPPMLLRNGWTKDSIKAGEAVTVSGYQARSGLPVASTKSVKTAEGKDFFGGVRDNPNE